MRRNDEIYVGGYQGSDQLEPADSLAGDLRDEPLDAGYDPPDRETVALRRRTTEREEWRGETLDERLYEEEPDVDDDDLDIVEQDDRCGRLVASGEPGEEAADDLGPAGWAATAEEAAMHIVEPFVG
jgi:hypothetical protein